MELLLILLSGLFSVVTPVGFVVDLLTGNLLDNQVQEAEQLVVRIDNTPSYQLAKGKIDRIRIASRGVNIHSLLKINTLELETDPIDLNLRNLETNNLEEIRKSLRKPLQGAVRLIVTEQDLNQTLQSAEVQNQLQQALNRLIKQKTGSSAFSYKLLNPNLEFQKENILRLEFQLTRIEEGHSRFQELSMSLECQIKIREGTKIELVKLRGTVNDRPISDRLLQGFAKGISDRLNLDIWEQNRMFVRLLQLKIDNNQIELAAFVRMHQRKGENLDSNTVNSLTVTPPSFRR